MAFCDVIWAEKILKLTPYDAFDIVCFHPYRPPNAPEDAFDFWELDQYVKSWQSNEKGLAIHDIFGTRRLVPLDPVRTKCAHGPPRRKPRLRHGPEGPRGDRSARPGVVRSGRMIFKVDATAEGATIPLAIPHSQATVRGFHFSSARCPIRSANS